MPSIKIKHKLSKAGISIIAIILFSLCSFLLSSLSSSAHASADNGTTSNTATVTLNLNSAISIRTLDSTASSEIDTLSLELTPTPSGRFIKDTTIVDVAASNATGYILYMTSNYTNPYTSTAEVPVYTTDLIHNESNVASAYSIPTIDPTLGGTVSSNTISEADFSTANTITSGVNSNPNVNHWGYSLNAIRITEANDSSTGNDSNDGTDGTDSNDGTNNSSNDSSITPTITPNTNPATTSYYAIPSYNSPDTINSAVSTAVEHSYTPVTLGVNVDTNIASGTYTNKLEFTAIVMHYLLLIL